MQIVSASTRVQGQIQIKLEALNYWFENHPESLHARFNKEFILEYAKFLLQNNNTKFNNEFYKQI